MAIKKSKEKKETDSKKTVKPSIWFKLTYSIADMYIERVNDDLPVVKTTDNKKEIFFFVRTFPKIKKIQPQLCCIAQGKYDVSPELKEMFVLLSKRILPLDKPPQIVLPHSLSFGEKSTIDEKGNIPDKWVVPLESFPKRFIDKQREVSSELSDLIKGYIKTLRWIQGTSGKQSPFGHVSLEWSLNKKKWHHAPSDFSVSVVHRKGIDLKGRSLSDVNKIWGTGEREPISHELIREAFDIANSNPRSALLIGCTALETGLKNYIKYLVPDSEILLEKLQSPSVITMAQEVIPHLHTTLNISHAGLPLEKLEADYFKKWIFQRNRIAHGVEQNLKGSDLLSFLKKIRKLLYLLDSYRGHEWARALTKVEPENTPS